MLLSADCLTQLHAAQKIYLAYSGGIDSQVLLQVCATQAMLTAKITAVYVHHGLQPLADAWAEHCERESAKLKVDFCQLRVNAHAAAGESPEEAARNARYTALKNLLKTGDILLIAQHQEDQLETVLLQLFRGAGVQGLAAMPQLTAFGQGLMLRPLLNISKQTIQNYAEQQQLSWVVDPTNNSEIYDRNFLRKQIIPLLKTRWENVDKTVARSANHCATAQQLLNELAQNLFISVLNPTDNSLSIQRLLNLSVDKQALVIRAWFAHLGLRMPSTQFIAHIFNQVIATKTSANPQLRKGDVCLRRYQDKLFCEKNSPRISNKTEFIWENTVDKIVLVDGSFLERQISNSGISASLWSMAKIRIRFRQGGEKIRLRGRQGQHTLKNLFQDRGISPQEREIIPLIYFDEQLAAVADLWIDARFLGNENESGYQIVWHKTLNQD